MFWYIKVRTPGEPWYYLATRTSQGCSRAKIMADRFTPEMIDKAVAAYQAEHPEYEFKKVPVGERRASCA